MRACALLIAMVAGCGAAELGGLPGSSPASCPAVRRAAISPLHATRGGIGGVVLDHRCRGAAGVDVIVRSPALAEPPAATTDAAGRFLVDDLPRGVYDVIFIDDAAMWELHDVAVQPGIVEHIQTRQPETLELPSS